MLTLGIDDAGRGPLIGPMILAGVLVDSDQEKALKKAHIRDSKIVSQNERVRLADFIRDNCIAFHIVKTYPDEIDSSLASGTNLNTLEAMKTAAVINAVNTTSFWNKKIKVIVDCPSVNISAWRGTLLGFIEYKENLTVVCEHKADANHVSVSAGSILAKATREEEVLKIRRKYGEIGSGYPSDPYTIKFLREHGIALGDSGIFRKTWGTWKKMYGVSGNLKGKEKQGKLF